MAEPAASQPTEAASGRDLLPRVRDLPLAAAGTTLVALLAAYLVSISSAADPGPLLRADAPFGLQVVFRMNLVTIAIIAYSVGVGLLDYRRTPYELKRLRRLLDCDDAQFAESIRASLPTPGGTLLALALGGAFGAAIPFVSYLVVEAKTGSVDWGLHDSWSLGLMILLFALLGLVALWGTRSARLYSSLARRYARVQLLDIEPFRIFATRGLRLALVWFVGSGMALLLIAGSQIGGVVIGVILTTCVLGAVSLVLPCLGIRERIRQAKADELTRVRREIDERLAALRDGYTERSIELPGLIAWEARVTHVPEWPFGVPVLLRFVLLALIPLGSWLGGALVERLVDGVLGS